MWYPFNIHLSEVRIMSKSGDSRRTIDVNIVKSSLEARGLFGTSNRTKHESCAWSTEHYVSYCSSGVWYAACMYESKLLFEGVKCSRLLM